MAYSGQTLGLSNTYIFWRIRMPYCRQGVLAGTVLAFAQEMANAAVLPVERKIPQNMVDEVEKYLYKKELAEAGGCSR